MKTASDFWTNIRFVPGPEDRPWLGECWEWTGARNGEGYAICKWFGKVVYVHRLILYLVTGKIPPGKLAIHACDRRWCVRPLHLSSGTYSRNLRDAWSRRRRSKPSTFTEELSCGND